MIDTTTEDDFNELVDDSCEHCGDTTTWERCDFCGGDGFLDGETLMEEDPLWYGPDSIETCDHCKGKGGWAICWNKECTPPGREAVNGN